MKWIAFVFVAVLTASCSSQQVKILGAAQIQGKDYNEVFSSSIESAMRAGFTIISANKEVGLITANNLLLMSPAPNINIFVRQDKDIITVKVSSVNQDQHAEREKNKDNVTLFCKRLSEAFPSALCRIERQWYDKR